MRKHIAMLTPLITAVGVRRAQRKPGRPVVKNDQSERTEDQSDFGF
jgi:hypothetical protein